MPDFRIASMDTGWIVMKPRYTEPPGARLKLLTIHCLGQYSGVVRTEFKMSALLARTAVRHNLSDIKATPRTLSRSTSRRRRERLDRIRMTGAIALL